MRHLSTGQPAVRVLSRVPEKRLRAVGDKADAGSVVSVLFLDVSSLSTRIPFAHPLTYIL